MLLQPLLWLDVWALSHSLYARQARLGAASDGVRRLVLSEGPRPADVLKDWKTLDTMLTRCRRVLAGYAADWDIDRAELEWLERGAVLPWTRGADDAAEAHLCLVTNPLARLYAGPEMYAPRVGEMVLSSPNGRAWRGAGNHGETPRVHLVLTLRRRAAAQA